MNFLQYKKQVQDLEFTTIAAAKKQTGLSYLMGLNSSSKIKKGAKLNYLSGILYLAPHKSSGFNTCSMASKGCILGCLNTSGRVKMDTKNTILNSRLKKTWLFYANRKFFNSWLHAEIKAGQRKAEAKNMHYSVRLNGTSDLDLRLFNVLETFKDVQFYDYTKVFNRLETFKNVPNYHLTFSYSESNFEQWQEAINLGFNVAVPFMGKILPEKYMGLEVFDADVTDLRFLDEPKASIAGLRVKNIKSKTAQQKSIKSGFIVDPQINK
tara:strand:+ start:22234 stop:23034 length:801 start_codon:yes stop_codon:yes gene_type:complete